MSLSPRVPATVRSLVVFAVLAFCAVAAPSAYADASCFGDNNHYVRATHSVALQVGCFDDANPSATFTFSVGTPANASKGTVSGPTDGENPGEKLFTYAATAGFTSGEDTFTVHVTSSAGGSIPDISITVLGEGANDNHIPDCFDGTAADDRDSVSGSTDVFLGCFDQDSDPLTYSITSDPTKGTGSLQSSFGATMYHYTVSSGQSGDDQFSYKANDGFADSDAATHYMTVSGPVPPSCPPVTFSVRTNGAKTVEPSCDTTAEEDYSLSVVGAAAHGTASIVDGALHYEPNHGYTGSDSFTYRATGSSTGAGSPATVTVTVSDSANTVPSCFGDSETVRAGSEIDLTPECFDDDGDAMTYAKKTDPTLGTLLGDVETGSYAAAVAYRAGSTAGTDHVTLTANDGHGGVTDIAITITVVAANANHAPTCFGSPASTTATVGGTSYLSAYCYDQDGDPMTKSVKVAPAKGTLVASPYGYTYTPNAGVSGSDTLTVTISDDHGGATDYVVNVTLVNPDKPSCATPAAITLRPGTGRFLLSEDESCTADHWATSSVRVTSGAPAHGTIKTVDGAILYTASSNGDDTVTFVVSNGSVDSDPITQTIHVSSAAEHAPTCYIEVYDDTLLVTQNGSKLLPFSCWDVDGDHVTLSPSALHGSVAVQPGSTHTYTDEDTAARSIDGELLYTPTGGYTGADTVTLAGSDGTQAVTDGFSDPAAPPAQHIQVMAPASMPAPSCYLPGLNRLRAGDSATVELYCSDPAGATPSVTHDTPTHGTLTDFAPVPGSSGAFTATYTAASGYVGWGSFHYQVHAGGRDGTNVKELVRSVPAGTNHAPTCVPQTYEVQAGHGVTVDPMDFCSDADGDRLTLTASSGPSHGSLVGPDASHVYTFVAAAGSSGGDSMTVAASDGHGGTSGSVAVSFSIEADAPATVTQTASAGDTVGNAPPGATPTAAVPFIAAVTTPTGGSVTVTEQAATTSAPSGFSLVGREFHIEAPDATAEQPLKLAFSVDQSQLPAGTDRTNLQVFRNGAAVADCQNPTVAGTTPLTATDDNAFPQATPNPCVARRQTVGTGDVRLVVLSSHASTWNFGAAKAPSGGGSPSGGTPSSGTPSGGTPSGGTTNGGGGAAKDTTAPTVRLAVKSGKLKAILAKGLTVTPTCSEACTVKVKLTVSGKDAKKLHLSKKAVTTVVGTATSSGKAVVARFTAKAAKALKKAKKLVLTITVQASDAAGNLSRPVSQTITLKR